MKSVGARIYMIVFSIIWFSISFFGMAMMINDGMGEFAIVPGLFALFGFIPLIQGIKGEKTIDAKNKNLKQSQSVFSNNKMGRPAQGKLLNIWNESRTKVTKTGEETSYVYFAKFQYVDNLGNTRIQDEQVQLNIYSELMHTHNDEIPVIVYNNGATLDLEKIDPMNRFQPHE